MENATRLPWYMTDAEMKTLTAVNLYFVDADHECATPNFRYCQPSTPRYVWDDDELTWDVEAQ